MKKWTWFCPLLICLCFSHFALADINTYFTSIKNNPSALTVFFKTMPKGGELHYHFSGGAYPEEMLAASANSPVCINGTSYVVKQRDEQSNCLGITNQEALQQTKLYNEIVQAWSMKNFIPGKESSHDHFFNSFGKFAQIVQHERVQLLIDIMTRAANQNELYLEILETSLNNEKKFAPLISSSPTLTDKQARLLADPTFQQSVKQIVAESEQLLRDARNQLNCTGASHSKICNVTVKFQFYVKRDGFPDSIFVQALAGFLAAQESIRQHGVIVGINIVQPEDALLSLRYYRHDMEIFKFLHKAYPSVHIALHAGELSPTDLPLKDLTHHIHDAIFIGQAERIGHGVDIAYENNNEKLVEYMAQHPIPVEVNLTSNQLILNIFGRHHPLNFYLAHHVPVVLSTDDEGILRTNLTREYVHAVLEHNLDYPTIKTINRNALTYSFLPGKSLWQDANQAKPVLACTSLVSKPCEEFVKRNEKARLQRSLEILLQKFEQQFTNNRERG